MNRLITSGCSFTQYCWPTWADYLGMHYSEHIQQGICAIDCASISRKILSTDILPNDHVVIMWTAFDRHSLYTEDGWDDVGCILSRKQYFTNYYHPYERFLTMLDAIKLVDLDSKHRKYEVFHFFAYPWLTGEIENSVHTKIKNASRNFFVKNFYNENDLESFRNDKGVVYTTHKYNERDDHPTPLCHWQWLTEYMGKFLPIAINDDIKTQVLSDHKRVLSGDID